MKKVVYVEALEQHRLNVRFEDGVGGEVDCSGLLYGSAFEPLKDPGFFARVEIDDFGAICWPNGADLAPDALYEQLLGEQQHVAEPPSDYSA